MSLFTLFSVLWLSRLLRISELNAGNRNGHIIEMILFSWLMAWFRAPFYRDGQRALNRDTTEVHFEKCLDWAVFWKIAMTLQNADVRIRYFSLLEEERLQCPGHHTWAWHVTWWAAVWKRISLPSTVAQFGHSVSIFRHLVNSAIRPENNCYN